MSGRTILFCREVPWETELPVSTRKLAERFADEGWQVLWVAPPLAPWPISKKLDHRLVEQYESGGLHVRPGVFAYTPRTRVPFSLQLPAGREALAARTWRWCSPRLHDVFAKAGVDAPDVLWISNLRGLGLSELFPSAPILWQVTDDYPSLSRTPEACRDLCRLNFSAADRILFSSPGLAERTTRELGLASERVGVLLHGVDESRLSRPQGPDPLADIPGPRLVYVGNTERADRPTLRSLAASGMGHVVVIGPTDPFERDGDVPPNLHLLGRCSADEVGRLLPWCDVGLVSYSAADQEAAERGGNPMKLYEYAAAGLAIVGPRLSVFEELRAPVRIAPGPDDVLEAVASALSERALRGEEARAWARQHTWGARFDEAETLANRLLAERPSATQANVSLGAAS